MDRRHQTPLAAAPIGIRRRADDEAAGEVTGVIINEDWKDRQPAAYRLLGAEWRPVRAIFNDLHTRYTRVPPTERAPAATASSIATASLLLVSLHCKLIREPASLCVPVSCCRSHRFKATYPHAILPGQIVHTLYFGCVVPELRKKGVFTELWRQSVNLAQDYHYQHMACEVAAGPSAKVCESLGFQEVPHSLTHSPLLRSTAPRASRLACVSVYSPAGIRSCASASVGVVSHLLVRRQERLL